MYSGESQFSPQRRITPTHPPHSRQPGGASRANRRTLRHKIRDSAALLALPAAHLGGNFATSADFNASCNIYLPKLLTDNLAFLLLTKD
jgi:hypothetical protein